MKGKKKKIMIISAVFAALAIGAAVTFAAKKPKAVEVNTVAATKKNLVQSISVSGYVEPKDKYEVVLNPAQKVVKVYVKEGQMVKKGDILVKLDTTDIETQLKKAQIQLDIAKLNLNNTLKSSSKGQKKQLENSVTAAKLTLDNSQRAFEDAKRRFEANQKLYADGYISKEEYEQSKKAVSDLENQVKSAEIQLNNAKNSLADFDVNTSEQAAQQRKQIELASADITALEKKLEDSIIRSTIDGVVTKLDAKENQYPTANSIVQVIDISQYKVNAEVNQYDAVLVRIGQKASIKVKGLDKKYIGTISSIGQTAEVKMNGTSQESKVKVELTIDNPDSNIKAGYEVDADINLREKPNVIAVSFDSIKQEKSGKKYIFAVESGKVVKKYITTGLETDFDVEVVQGLKDGDKYITSPPDTLKEGDLVKLPEVNNK
jgi:HlyD family secretion protein